jgi:hypothetical protein
MQVPHRHVAERGIDVQAQRVFVALQRPRLQAPADALEPHGRVFGDADVGADRGDGPALAELQELLGRERVGAIAGVERPLLASAGGVVPGADPRPALATLAPAHPHAAHYLALPFFRAAATT